MKKLALLLALLFAGGAGVAAASALTSGHDHSTHAHPDQQPERLEPDGGPVPVETITGDPDGGPAWGVRTYRSKHGLTCPSAGRVEDGWFGRAGTRGELVPLPVAADGACADLRTSDVALAVRRYADRPGQGARAVVFGAASPRVESVTLERPGQDARRLSLSAHGAFLAVERDVALHGASLTIATTDGDSRTVPLDR